MTHVARIELRNWARFAGEVAVDLGPEVYAVEAEWDGDKARSNWGGKSKLVEAIPFALFGWHRDAKAGAGAEDLVITHGEAEGGVLLRLSTGHVVERARERGGSATLKVYGSGSVRPAVGPAAQEEVQRLVGLSAKDFLASCFVRQKQTARFVAGDAGDRQELIAEWCQLKPLERAADRASKALADATAKRDRAEARASALGEVIARFLPGRYGEHECRSAEQLASAIAALRELAGERHGRLELLEQRRVQGAEWDARARAMADEGELGRQVEAARAEAERLRGEVPAGEDLGPLFAAHQAARSERDAKRRLAAGRFDGVCPVGGCQCPIADDLNAARDRNASALKAAEKAEAEAWQALEDAKKRDAARLEKERAAERAEGRARSLAEQAARRKTERLQGPRPERVEEAELARARTAQQEAQQALARAEEAERQVLATLRDVAAAREEAARLGAEVAELRGACVVLGRSGAQRVVGSSMVGAVEEAANAEMGAAGIGLVVRVPWDREGGKLAPECEACGTPIKGEAIKACPACGARRGKQRILGPFVSLSDWSGAAEDIAGLSLQLAASSWLRRRRSTAWSTAVLDEPFGALDEANRTALAAHLLAMLRGRHGFQQAFVIAHHRGVLDAMPARIIVRAGARSSRLEVS